MTRRIGVLGGTFNPIHLGHLMIAEVAREAYQLEKVIFVPARIPPHKHTDVIDASHRYAMTKEAVADNPFFEISDIEMKREGPSYTIDTILHFEEQYGEDTRFFFIGGTDTIQALPRWRYIDELLAHCEFIGAVRPDGSAVIDATLDALGPTAKDRIHILQVPELKLSATYLRERLRKGQTVRYMLPKCVVDYIVSHDIYGEE